MQRSGTSHSLPTASPRPMIADILCASPVSMSDTETAAAPSSVPPQMLTMRAPTPTPMPAPTSAPRPRAENLVGNYFALYTYEDMKAFWYSIENTTSNTASRRANDITDAAETAALFAELRCYYHPELRASLAQHSSSPPFLGGASVARAEAEIIVTPPIFRGCRSIWSNDAGDVDADVDSRVSLDGDTLVNDDIDSGVDIDDDVDVDDIDDVSDDGEDESGEDKDGDSQDSDEDADDEAEDSDDEDEDEDEDEDDDEESVASVSDLDAASDQNDNATPAPGTLAELLSGSEPLSPASPGAQEAHGAVGDGQPLRGDTDENAADNRDNGDIVLQLRLHLLDLVFSSDWLPASLRGSRNVYGAVGDGRPRRDSAVVSEEQRVTAGGAGEGSSQEHGQRAIRFSDSLVRSWLVHDARKRQEANPSLARWEQLRDLMAKE